MRSFRHPDGQRLFVSCRRSDEVLELTADDFEVLRRFRMRGQPTGLELSGDGDRLYVAVHAFDQVAVLDLDSGRELTRLATGRAPMSIRRSPSAEVLYVSSLLPLLAVPGSPPRNEVTVIDGERLRVRERIMLENANIGRDLAFTRDGSLGLIAVSRPKNLIPEVQVARGWVVTNGFALVYPGSTREPIQLLVDLPNQSFADPHGIVVTPDADKFYLSCAGANTVIGVDMAKLHDFIDGADASTLQTYANHLGASREYVASRIQVGANPTGLAVSPDGRWLYVCNRLEDTISVVDTRTDAVTRTLALGEVNADDPAIVGIQTFHSASRVFQNQFSCASCHPMGGVDGLQYDLEPDGLGQNILDNRSLRGLLGTAPFKWTGTNPDIATQCGTRTAKWIARTGWFSSTQVVALADYILSIPANENPYRPEDGRLTAAQKRGRELFERTVTNDGEPIPERDQCHFCHAGPKFTSLEKFDVGTMSLTDTKNEFDNAHLVNLAESAPYLHDGRALSLEEIWTVYNPDDRHGISSDWTKQQLNDLVEYLKVVGTGDPLP